jgi:malic enzyme
MDRPKITKEMVFEAAKEIAEKLDGDAETIAEHYRHPMDGYELARELDRYAGWDFTMPDVEELDCMSSIVSGLHREAEKKWAAETDIQPPLPIGTRIKEGVIDSVCNHSAARYRVKENGCTNEGRFLLIRFEDAVAA